MAARMSRGWFARVLVAGCAGDRLGFGRPRGQCPRQLPSPLGALLPQRRSDQYRELSPDIPAASTLRLLGSMIRTPGFCDMQFALPEDRCP
ncbi:hypothetical protein ACX6XY_14670 [Streptomyces sp. O3]